MPKRLRSVGLEFVETAPVRLVFSRRAGSAPEALFAQLSDVPSWPEWFGGVSEARPLAGGERRVIGLRGGARFLETVVTEPPARYSYRIDETNVPGVRAMWEDWRLDPDGDGTLVTYTMALDGHPVCRAVVRLLGPGLGRTFRAAVRSLDERIAAAPGA
ncbi:SRPBCC family protein [Streptomyces sp. NPDC054784]